MLRGNKLVILVALIFSVTLLVQPVAGSPTPPVASFTYTPEQPILGDTLVFDASDSYDPDGGKIDSYKWDFDDGTPPQSIPDPITHHKYSAEGTYNVTLTVTDDEGETDTTWQSVTVREYPVAFFTFTPDRPIAGYPVTFNASLSTENGGTIMNYTWDFGDENVTTMTSPVINHIYTTPRNYTVTLNVTDSEGLWDTESKSITVRNIPVAKFTYSPERPIRNEPVTFDASLSTPNGGTIVSYFWNFGDGSNGTGMIVNHTYMATGDYTATLTITDYENLTDTAQATFTVRDYPVAFFEYKPKLPLVSETVNFDASDSTADGGTIMNYTWDFGDGSSPVTETDPKIDHIYTTFGTYNVTLTIADSEDLTDTFMDTVRILIHPVANFTHSPTWPVVDETVTFNAIASYDPDRYIANYTWNFGDGSPILVTDNPVTTHSYTAEGTYNVTLTVTDDDGLTDTVWELITVYTFLYEHDVAITSVTPSATEVYVGRKVDITVVAKNEGTAVETFNVTVYYDATSIGTKIGIILLPSEEEILMFSWDTSGVTPGDYTISAQASVVPATPPETDTADNTLENGTIKVKKIGDINGDGVVNVLDVILACINLGPVPPRPSRCDINGDGTVNVMDVILVCINLG